jgi:hypothetical protein
MPCLTGSPEAVTPWLWKHSFNVYAVTDILISSAHTLPEETHQMQIPKSTALATNRFILVIMTSLC